LEQYLILILFAVASAGILATAHYVFREQEIVAPWTYVIGVGTIQSTLILWLLYLKVDPLIVGGVIVITAAVGGAILLCYLIDKAKRADRARPYVEAERSDRS
jgi:hypothetical protein